MSENKTRGSTHALEVIYECAENQKCGWRGIANELAMKPKQLNPKELKAECPKCGCAFLWIIIP